MKKLVLRLSVSLIAVLGLWTLVWLPLVLGQSSAAEPQEEAIGNPNAPVTIIEYASLAFPALRAFPQGRAAAAPRNAHRSRQGAADLP